MTTPADTAHSYFIEGNSAEVVISRMDDCKDERLK